MKQRRVMAALLTAVMVISLAACNSAQKSSADVTERKEAERTTQERAESAEKEQDAEESGFNTQASIEETILAEEADFKITATALSYTSYSVDLKVTIENSSDQELSFMSGTMGYGNNAVNGYMIEDGYMCTDVAAGKKANETISFSSDALSIYGITQIAEIQLGIQVNDSDNNAVYKGVSAVKTSIADSYDAAIDTYQQSITSGMLEEISDCSIDYYAEDELYSQGGVRIISETLLTNVDGEKMLLFEVVNETSDNIYGCVSDVSMNGLAVRSGAWSSDSINPGARCVIDLSMSSLLEPSYWELFGIAEIGEIAFSFGVNDSEYDEMIAPQELCISMSDAAAPLDDSGVEVYQEDGIRIVSKGIVEAPSSYTDDVHMLFLIENTAASECYVGISYDSLSVNGFMTDEITYETRIASGGMGILDVDISDSSLEKNGITGTDDITEAEVTFEITNGKHDTIAEPVVSIGY